ncbi:MAG: formylglycine-generating enzyme family protein, partial [Planctomycetota bacterium]
MSRAAVYCDRCARLIPPGQIADAVVTDETALCATCAAALTPEERAAFTAPADAPGPSPEERPGGRPKASAGRRRRAKARTARGVSHAPAARVNPQAIVPLAAAGVLVVVALALLLLGGGNQKTPSAASETGSSTTPPAPPPATMTEPERVDEPTASAPVPAWRVPEPAEPPAPPAQPPAPPPAPRAEAQEEVAEAAFAPDDGVWAAEGLPETTPVGDPRNDPDSTGFGAVAYSYRIGKYEVTNAQYCEFLNAVARAGAFGLYQGGMAGEYGGITRSGAPGGYTYSVKPRMADKPVNFVSWYDALRYANWLTNGRRDGGTETGSYTFARTGGGWRVMMPDHAAFAAGRGVKWVLASENEWYKAAYYDPRKPGGAGYWPFAAGGHGAPAGNVGGGAPSDVGAYGNAGSAYGTFDQNGNMWEWNETRGGGNCGVRGGSFYVNDH